MISVGYETLTNKLEKVKNPLTDAIVVAANLALNMLLPAQSLLGRVDLKALMSRGYFSVF